MDDAAALTKQIAEVKDLAQTCWLLVSSALVLFMQAGFACLEAGSVRHKNSINVAIKNLVDMCASVPAFFIIGYALMLGADYHGLIGEPKFFLQNVGPKEMAVFFFQVTFCATSATIVSGGVAERCRFLPYVIISVGVGLFIYPVFGHWVWGQGWLSKLGYHDFAGSSVVHMLGGGVTLAGIQILGPRAGRFDENGRPRPIPPSSIPLAACGAFILLFGWVGFNGGSAPLGEQTATIIVNTVLAGCFGGLLAMLLNWGYTGSVSVEMVINGLLGGLVAITAGADCTTPTAASIIGMLGGGAVVFGTYLLERLQLDDAVGAVPVHFFGGITGVIATGVFGNMAVLGPEATRLHVILVQCLGAVVCAVWGYAMGRLLWILTSTISKLRVGDFEERVGMNFSEHQVEDTIQDLTETVVAATRGLHLNGQTLEMFDRFRDSETARLARAVQELAGKAQDRVTIARKFTTSIEELRQSLLDERAKGQETTSRAKKQSEDATKVLDNLIQFLHTHHRAHMLFPVFLDLVNTLRERLTILSETLPGTARCWEGVGQTASRLDGLVMVLGERK
jgi:Amt family ammonium transporter